ncbi:MAG: hypothetical protein HC906_18185 [Bacteroidales bacterium]|nr:hypothetical protein [Bacteroidales bacterium]
MAEKLKKMGIYSIEFIPLRNSPEVLEDYASYFFNQGFIVTFGSEHNTPQLTPLRLYTRNGAHLSEPLREINYKGACIIAAHQYLFAVMGKGFLKEDGTPEMDKMDEYVTLGDALIRFRINNEER